MTVGDLIELLKRQPPDAELDLDSLKCLISDGVLFAQARRRRHDTVDTFASSLLDRLAQRGWTQLELAFRSGLAESTVVDFLRAHRLPLRSELEKLATAFELRIDDLLSPIAAAKLLRRPPPLEIRSGADPSTSWVTIHRLVESSQLERLLLAVDLASVRCE